MKITSTFALYTALTIASTTVLADQVVSDDLIIQGSLCVGLPCVNDEEFGFNTLKVKSATPSILFVDTSTSASFPTTDWIMSVKEDLNNISVLTIENVDTGLPVLQLSANQNGGVAIGEGSVLMAGAVTFGSEGLERRVTQVADAVDETDAVTLQQLQGLEDGLDDNLSDLEGQMSALSTRIDELVTRLDDLSN